MLQRNLQIWLVVVIFVVAGSGKAYASDLGVIGKTYRIAERDAVEELQSRAARVDWKKHLAKIKPENYRPENSTSLPRAANSARRLIDMTYVLDMDIPDGKGGILYPRGYTFNPLDYLPFRKTIVVVNGNDKEQLAWFQSSEYAGRIDVMLLLTEGAYVSLAKTLHRPVFYADSRLVGKFDLRVVPSVIRQSGRMMEVIEVYVEKNNKKPGRVR